MMIVADQDRVEDGDRVIIFNGVTIQELRKFVSDIPGVAKHLVNFGSI